MGIKSVKGTAQAGFPAGLRVLVVDDDYLTLRIIEMFLKACKYEAVTLTKATDALKMLHETQGAFDVIITDIHMPIMGGFEFLLNVKKEFDIPVIMISADDEVELIAKGMRSGAHSFYAKPITKDFAKNLWQYVFLKFGGKNSEGTTNNGLSKKVEADHSSLVNLKKQDEVRKTIIKVAKEKEEENDDEESDEERDPPKKERMVWTSTLHEKFVAAIKHIGVNKAVPKKILEVMNVEGVSRTNIASHLQKYRLYLKGSKDSSASKFWDRHSTNPTYGPGYAPGLSQFFDQTHAPTYPLPQGASRYSPLTQAVLNQINIQQPLVTTAPNFTPQTLANVPTFGNTSNFTDPTMDTSSYRSNYAGLQLCEKEGMVGLRQAGLHGGITANMTNFIPHNVTRSGKRSRDVFDNSSQGSITADVTNGIPHNETCSVKRSRDVFDNSPNLDICGGITPDMTKVIPQNETRSVKRSGDVFEDSANIVIPEYNAMNFNQATQFPPPPPSMFMNSDMYQEVSVAEEPACAQQNETVKLDSWSDILMNNSTNDISYLLTNVGNEYNQENNVEGLLLDPHFGVGELQFDESYLTSPPNIQCGVKGPIWSLFVWLLSQFLVIGLSVL